MKDTLMVVVKQEGDDFEEAKFCDEYGYAFSVMEIAPYVSKYGLEKVVADILDVVDRHMESERYG